MVCGHLRSPREDLDIGADSVTVLSMQCLSIAEPNETERKVRILFVLNQKMFYSLAVKVDDFSKEKIS